MTHRDMMTRVAVATCALLLGGSPVLAASGGDVGVHRSETGSRTTFTLHGGLIDLTIVRGEAGRQAVVALVGPPVVKPAAGSAPVAGNLASLAPLAPCGDAAATTTDTSQVRQLLRIDYGDDAAITVLRDQVPPDTYALGAFDRDGDGRDEILLYRPSSLATIPLEAATPASTGAPDPLPFLSEATMSPVSGTRGLTGAEDTVGWFVLPELGSARIFGPPADGNPQSAWTPLLEAPLPIKVEQTDDDVKMEGVPLRAVATRDGTARLLAAGPLQASGNRLRTILINPAGSGHVDTGQGGFIREVWSALPTAEKVIESRYMEIAGRPALVVLTRAAAKLSLFEEKLLRLFWLDASDRSHAGAAPALAVESGMNLWQRGAPLTLDVDRDGHEDLVVAYWKGLKDARVVLEVYPGLADGAFERSAETTEFDVEGAVRSFLGYGRDVTGDGVADLLVSAAGELRVHLGLIPRRGHKGLVEPQARWAFPVSKAEGESFDIDIDFGDDDGVNFSTSWDPLSDVHFIDLPGYDSDAILVRSVNADGKDQLHLIQTAGK